MRNIFGFKFMKEENSYVKFKFLPGSQRERERELVGMMILSQHFKMLIKEIKDYLANNFEYKSRLWYNPHLAIPKNFMKKHGPPITGKTQYIQIKSS